MSSSPTPLPGYGLSAQDESLRSATGQTMGQRTSPKKRKAVKVNGRTGGRPVVLGVLTLRYAPENVANPRVKVAWSRSYGGLIFTKPDGSREFWREGACASPEEGLRLMVRWFTPFHPDFAWYPFHGPRWRYQTAAEKRAEARAREEARRAS